ncbi:unnamed protein product [Dicrocoelium dendriticum]|nr:unnamed protein product [Dicrocoelium dendriticum]
MAVMSDASSFVDDSDVFHACMRARYGSFDDFKSDFENFQRQSCTAFFIYNAQNAAHCRRNRKKRLPRGFPYYFAKYCCVHRRRKGDAGRRYRNYECRAYVTVRIVNGAYEIVGSCLEHTHSFQVGKSWLYVRNRRLSPEEEKEVHGLMECVKSTIGIRHFAFERFQKHLHAADVRAIRARFKKSEQRRNVVSSAILASKKAHSSSELSPKQELVCPVCNREEDDSDDLGVFWLQCQCCASWYHQGCVGYMKEDFVCTKCTPLVRLV